MTAARGQAAGWRGQLTCGAGAVAGGLVLHGVGGALVDGRWVFLSSLVLFGLAHGACDLWVPGWVLARRATVGATGTFALAYTLVAGLVLLGWCQPTVALGGFLLLTAWHWGSADTAVLTRTASWRFGLLAWGRGLMVMSAPGVFHPAAAGQVLGSLAPEARAFLLEPARLQAVAAPTLLLALAMQAVPLLSPPSARRGTDGDGTGPFWLETLFLLGFFGVFSPLVATALYFIWFHAWRHIERLGRWQSPGEGRTWVRVLRFHAAALPCTAGALAMLWLVARTWPGDPLRAYLILLSALTLPHAALVWWLDRVETAPPTALG